MKLLPQGRRQWIALLLRLCIVALAFAGAILFMTSMPGRSFQGAFPALSPDESSIRENLKQHVSTLAGTIGERNLRRFDALNAAAQYVADAFKASGFEVQEQQFTVEDKPVKNLEVVIGSNAHVTQTLIVGAHYDSAMLTPGANDNASGVAVLLELARLLKTKNFQRAIRLVAFVNEEPPYFQTESMGSRVYAKSARAKGEEISTYEKNFRCFELRPARVRLPISILYTA
jgi:hypothetical protein